MGRIAGPSSAYGHHIAPLGGDTYRISWTIDTKHGRIRFPHLHSRTTDLAGARRFARRHGLTPPQKGACVQEVPH